VRCGSQDQQLLQLKQLRLEWDTYLSLQPDKLRMANIAEQRTLALAVDFAEADRAVNGLNLLGIPMNNAALRSITAMIIPLISTLYYLFRLLDHGRK
jgi:hypothetical protein